jgi:RNA polymerase sigma factor (sigma-70 family)
MAPKRPELRVVPPPSPSAPAAAGGSAGAPDAAAETPAPPAKGLTVRQQKLVELGLPMLERIVAAFMLRSPQLVEADLFGVGAMALTEAALNFREGSHASFLYYAKCHVRGRIRRSIGRRSLRERVEDRIEDVHDEFSGHLVLSVNLFSDSPEALEAGMQEGADAGIAAAYIASLLVEPQATAEEQMIALEGTRAKKAELEEAVESLSPYERPVVRGYYYEGVQLKQIAKEIGVTEDVAQNRHQAALKKLRKRLVGRGS